MAGWDYTMLCNTQGLTLRIRRIVLVLTCRFMVLSTLAETAESRTFFEERIRPVLAQDCYQCHQHSGPRKGGLALDDRHGLLKGGDSGPAVIPGSPNESLLMRLIRHEDPDRTMPRSGAKLDEKTVEDFAAWIRAGAHDPRDHPPTTEEIQKDTDWQAVMERRMQWWSFQPIKPVDIPLAGSNHPNPVDAFIEARLAAENLEASPEADRQTLIRRLSFALRGLPPTPEEMRRYLLDESPRAYENLVDEFLKSPRFGERWARHWMDWIRYADSHGSEGDPMIPNAWVYRDYLIRSLNQDVPYDQLLLEHLAGDLLAFPRLDQKEKRNESAIGTSHLRMVFHGFAPTDAMEEQIRFVDDQINTVSKAFLGVTVSCARCHDHKFDPISQRDYYAWYGIMASGRPGIIDARLRDDADAEQRESLEEIKHHLKELMIDTWRSYADQLPSNWEIAPETWKKGVEESKAGDLFWPLAKKMESDQAFRLLMQNAAKIREHSPTNRALHQWDFTKPTAAAPWYGLGPALEQGITSGSWIPTLQGDQVIESILPAGLYSHLISSKDAGALHSPKFKIDQEMDLWMLIRGEGGSMARYAVANYPRNGTVYPVENLNGGPWTWKRFNLNYWKGDSIHVELTTAADQAVLARLDRERSWFGVRKMLIMPSGVEPENTLLEEAYLPLKQAYDQASSGDINTLLEAYATSLQACIESWSKGRLEEGQAQWLQAWLDAGLLPNQAPSESEMSKLLEAWRHKELQLAMPLRVPGKIETKGFDQPLLERGDAKRPLDAVPRSFLSLVDDTPYECEDSGRLQLARDLIRQDNPLTRRVIVNRLWHHLFGKGLVDTPDNFGKLGSQPSHPELLDFLAIQFSTSGWSLKQTIRLLVTSNAWKRSSLASEEAGHKDPENHLWSHFDTLRLDAEAIRDQLLWVSSKLELDPMEGPPVSGINQRRSVFQRIKRNDLDPFLALFDAPTPLSTVGSRDSTNVPGQSLKLLNDRFIVDCAEAWADQVIKSHAGKRERIVAMFERIFNRAPSLGELALCEAYVSSMEEQKNQRLARVAELTRQMDTSQQALDAINGMARSRVMNQRQRSERTRINTGPEPLAAWDFSQGLDDQMGNLELTLHGEARLEDGALVLSGEKSYLSSSPIGHEVGPKTLETWLQIDDLTQRGGGVISLQDLDGQVFDAIVFAEQEQGRWLAGSDVFARTQSLKGPIETTSGLEWIHLAVVYEEDGMIRAYRNGKPYGLAYQSTGPVAFAADQSQVLIGNRHGQPIGNRLFRGRIGQCRLYLQALSDKEILQSFEQAGSWIPQDQWIKTLTLEEKQQRNDLSHRVLAAKEALKRSSDKPGLSNSWADLAHSLFNLKEFIYVR